MQVSASYDEKNDNDLVIGMNKLGVGVAMNNTVPATPSIVPVNPTNTNVNNIQLDDVQKLQQQLQDIKEQVSVAPPATNARPFSHRTFQCYSFGCC